LVPVLLSLWGCSRYQIKQTLEAYSTKPGFELKVIRTDSISPQHNKDVSKILSYLKGIKEVYILKFDSVKGSTTENQKLSDKLEKYIKSAHFENLMEIETKSLVGLYLKKDSNGDIDQVIFIKSGGRHSLYIWAPHSKT
jgi:hypothetical protein